MNKLEKLHDTIFKYGYFYDPLFVENYYLDINTKNPIEYSENTDLLFINSKVKNGKNLYKDFVKRNYKDKINPDIYVKYKEVLKSILEIAADYEKRYFGFATNVPIIILAKKMEYYLMKKILTLIHYIIY